MAEKSLLKNLINHVVRAVILLISGILAGYLLLVLVYLLPVDRVQENLSKSTDILTTEREYHRVIPGYISTQLDNYTDSWMMGNAAYDSELPVWKKALWCISADYGEGPLDGLVRYLSGESGYQEITYTRYWHGYLVILKPFFQFFDYADLRVVNIVLESMLVLGIFCKLIRRGYKGEAWGYLLSVMFVMPVVIPLSIQFSVIFYLTNLAVLVLLNDYDRIMERNGMLLYFQLIGMAASFFDFLTYPVASLGVPMVCLLLLDMDRGLWARCKNIICLSVSWGVGYGAMWMGKWILGTLVLKDHVMENALSQILMRSSHVQNGEKITIAGTWLRNVEFYFEKPYLILIGVCIAATMIGFVRSRRRISEVMSDSLPFVVTAMMPFVWYAFAGQHSYEHHWFTFRGLMTSVFACMCICAQLYRTDGRKD